MDIKQAAHPKAAGQTGVAPVGADTGATIGATARRGILAAGLAGVAMSLAPWLTGRAAASSTTPDTSTDSTTGATTAPEAATTTTAPPKQPTTEDIVLLDFAQSVELAIRDLYDVALDAGVFETPILADITAIREAHEGYASSIAGLIGREAANKRNNTLFDELQADFAGDVTAVTTAAAGLENSAVATHLDLLGQLLGVDGAALISSILIIEAQNATLLTSLSGVDDLAGQLAFEGTPLAPADYPTE